MFRSRSARGEIVAIAGVDGNGQSELIDAITGCASSSRAASRSPGRCDERIGAGALRPGFGHIPEDRQQRVSLLDFSIAENIALHDFRKPPTSRFGWLYPKRLIERAAADQGVRRPRRRTADARTQPLRRNQQKVISPARSIGIRPCSSLRSRPGVSMSARSSSSIAALIEERDEGRGVSARSLELDEVFSLADRILVIYEGEIVGEFPPTATRGGARPWP